MIGGELACLFFSGKIFEKSEPTVGLCSADDCWGIDVHWPVGCEPDVVFPMVNHDHQKPGLACHAAAPRTLPGHISDCWLMGLVECRVPPSGFYKFQKFIPNWSEHV